MSRLSGYDLVGTHLTSLMIDVWFICNILHRESLLKPVRHAPQTMPLIDEFETSVFGTLSNTVECSILSLIDCRISFT